MWMETMGGEVGSLYIVADIVQGSDHWRIVQLRKQGTKGSGGSWTLIECCIGGHGQECEDDAEEEN